MSHLMKMKNQNRDPHGNLPHTVQRRVPRHLQFWASMAEATEREEKAAPWCSVSVLHWSLCFSDPSAFPGVTFSLCSLCPPEC